MFRYIFLAMAINSLMLTGCGLYTLNGVEVSELSADKRVIYTSNNTYGKYTCAEPSPDAVKSLAQSISATWYGQAEISESFASTLASIGLRTATIQILRDLAYRACEAAANGSLAKSNPENETKLYEAMIYGVDDAAVALMAIEGLTGIHPAPAVAISSSASGTTVVEEGKSNSSASSTPATITFSGSINQSQPSSEQIQAISEAVLKIVEDTIKSTHFSAKDNSTSKEISNVFSNLEQR